MSTTNPAQGSGAGTGKAARPRHSGSRHKARQRALTLLFEAESRDVDPVELAENRRDYALELARLGEGGMPLVSDYAIAIITGVAEDIDRIDEILSSSLTDWSLDRLAAVDRTALRIGVWELLFTDDVPALTAVDEAVSLAREYSDDDAPRFVNGVLDKVLRDRDVVKEQLSHTSTVELAEEQLDAVPSTDEVERENYAD